MKKRPPKGTLEDKTPTTLKVMEWEIDGEPSRPPSKPDQGHEICSDTYQVLEWIVRQGLIKKFGYIIGHDQLEEDVRLDKMRDPAAFVDGIFQSIDRHEQRKRRRFDAAIELYPIYLEQGGLLKPSKRYEELLAQVGANNMDGPTWQEFFGPDGILIPTQPLRFGFEKFFYVPLHADRFKMIHAAKNLVERGMPVLKRVLSKMLDRPGKYLTEWLRPDFTRSKFLRHYLFLSAAAYLPLFEAEEDKLGRPTKKFHVYKLLAGRTSYAFRSDCLAGPGSDSSFYITAENVSDRIKDSKGFLRQNQNSLKNLFLISDELYGYLRVKNGRLRPLTSIYL